MPFTHALPRKLLLSTRVPDEDVRSLVAEATRWNEVWVAQQMIAAADIIDPLENPHGFCEELRVQLSTATSTGEAPTRDSAE